MKGFLWRGAEKPPNKQNEEKMAKKSTKSEGDSLFWTTLYPSKFFEGGRAYPVFMLTTCPYYYEELETFLWRGAEKSEKAPKKSKTHFLRFAHFSPPNYIFVAKSDHSAKLLGDFTKL